MHTCFTFGQCNPSDAVTSLSGGTSASAPMTAAAVADLLQVGRATGHPLTPRAVRQLLEETGREVATQPQVDRQLQVGPQIDITRAVEKLLGAAHSPTSIVRLSTAHRVTTGNAGANFVEAADPSAIDLSGPTDFLGNPTGESLVGPITFGVDATGLPSHGPLRYVLRVGHTRILRRHALNPGDAGRAARGRGSADRLHDEPQRGRSPSRYAKAATSSPRPARR